MTQGQTQPKYGDISCLLFDDCPIQMDCFPTYTESSQPRVTIRFSSLSKEKDKRSESSPLASEDAYTVAVS